MVWCNANGKGRLCERLNGLLVDVSAHCGLAWRYGRQRAGHMSSNRCITPNTISLYCVLLHSASTCLLDAQPTNSSALNCRTGWSAVVPRAECTAMCVESSATESSHFVSSTQRVKPAYEPNQAFRVETLSLPSGYKSNEALFQALD